MPLKAPNPGEFLTLADFLNWAAAYFAEHDLYYGHGTDNPWDEAVMLALYVLHLPGNNDRSLLDRKITIAESEQLISLARQRVIERMPAPYLTGEAWFAGEKYIVNRDVLIPRSPMAELIANHFQPWLGSVKPKRILDLCTGSGCIGIYCAKEFPNCIVDVSDISPQVLLVAQQNIELHKCDDRVNAVQSDLFAALQGRKYDIIISNPPYVNQAEMQDLPPEYQYEPVLALASGDDGLDLTRKILQQAKDYLTDAGLLIVEVGYSWHTLAHKLPQINFTWLEFEHGGEGVFLLTAEYLRKMDL